MENSEVKLCALIPKIACPRSKQKREKLVKMNLTVGSPPSRSSSSRLRILTSAILRGQCGESIWRHRWLSNQLCRAISSADLPLLWFHTKALEILNNRLHCQIHRKRSGSRNVRANFKQSVRRNFVGFVIALLLNQANSSCVYSESQTHPNNKILPLANCSLWKENEMRSSSAIIYLYRASSKDPFSAIAWICHECLRINKTFWWK